METQNLQLIPCDSEILQSAIAGNDSLAQKLGVIVPDGWTEFGIGALQYAQKKLAANTDEKGWWTYFPILKKQNKLIGSGGYKGKPTSEGIVELGYEIAPAYRNRGFASEMANGLIENAFQDERVKLIVAHTLGEENPSTKVLKKCGFEKIEVIDDPDDGLLWKWALRK